MKEKPKTSTGKFWRKFSPITSNKKTVELVGELRGMDIGDLTVDAYFRKIDTIPSRLSNLGSNVTIEDLVTYATKTVSC